MVWGDYFVLLVEFIGSVVFGILHGSLVLRDEFVLLCELLI